MQKDFEAGKFYKLNVTPSYGDNPVRYVAALCTRVLKRKIEFQYIYKNEKGERAKVKVARGLSKATDRVPASTYSYDKWSMICQTTADMETKKPGIWDSVEG